MGKETFETMGRGAGEKWKGSKYDKVIKRIKTRRNVGRREKGKRLLSLSLLTIEIISTLIPLPLTTIQGQCVFVHLCVCTTMCIGSQTGIPSLKRR